MIEKVFPYTVQIHNENREVHFLIVRRGITYTVMDMNHCELCTGFKTLIEAKQWADLWADKYE